MQFLRIEKIFQFAQRNWYHQPTKNQVATLKTLILEIKAKLGSCRTKNDNEFSILQKDGRKRKKRANNRYALNNDNYKREQVIL
jgi:hypothetical protein